MYFANASTRPAVEIESSSTSLRGTLKSLQVIFSWCYESSTFTPPLVHVVSDFQFYRTSVARESRSGVGILLSRYISQLEENRFAGMAIPSYTPLCDSA